MVNLFNSAVKKKYTLQQIFTLCGHLMDVIIYLYGCLGLECDNEHRNRTHIVDSYGHKARTWNLVLSE